MPRKNKPFSVLLIMRRIAVEVLGCRHQKIYQKKNKKLQQQKKNQQRSKAAYASPRSNTTFADRFITGFAIR